jgi:hypothetical protein
VVSGTSGIPDGTWRLGRRAFLAVAGATAFGTLAAGSALAQTSSPGTITDFPPPTSVDPIGDLAFALDADVDRIFRFVADEIRYEPYAGALRGAKGTLASRAGNSVDQALILAALLEAAGVQVRYATGQIDESTAATLLGTSVTPAEAARMDAVERLMGPRDQAPTASPDPSIIAQMQRPGSTPSDVEMWLTDQIGGTVSTIAEALAGAGITLPGTFTPVPMLERDQHVWVQVANGSGWLDLDPSLPGQPSGQALATADQTMDTVPDDLWHNLGLAVVAETVEGGTLAESTLLSVPATAADISDAPIEFVNVTPEGMKAVGGSIGGGLEGWKTYIPVLVIGEGGYSGRPFRFSTGETLFSGGGPAPEGETTAVWLQATVTAPGTEPVIVRRPVFDRVGDVVRASGAFDPTQVAPIRLESLGPDAPEEYAPARRAHWLTVTTGTPTFGRFAADSSAPGMRDVASIAQAYQVARELSASALGIDQGVRTFQNGANVAAVTLDVSAGSDGAPSEGLVSDILHRSFGHTPVGDVAATVAPALLSGVISHVAERLLHESPAASVDGSSPVGMSVGSVFEAAAAAGIGPRVLTGSALPDDVALPADVALRLGRRLADGWVAIIPARMVSLGQRERTGWWLVDPATGETIDEMDDGRGVAGEEDTLMSLKTYAEYQRIQKIGCIVAAVGGLVFLALSGGTGALAYYAATEGVQGGRALLLAALGPLAIVVGVGMARAAQVCDL